MSPSSCRLAGRTRVFSGGRSDSSSPVSRPPTVLLLLFLLLSGLSVSRAAEHPAESPTGDASPGSEHGSLMWAVCLQPVAASGKETAPSGLRACRTGASVLRQRPSCRHLGLGPVGRASSGKPGVPGPGRNVSSRDRRTWKPWWLGRFPDGPGSPRAPEKQQDFTSGGSRTLRDATGGDG